MTLVIVQPPPANVVVVQSNGSAVVQTPVVSSVVQQTGGNLNQEVLQAPQVLQIVTPGPRGPPGINGANGDGSYPAVTFEFGDATPAVVITLTGDVDLEIMSVSLEVEEAFDGVGAQVALGIVGNPELLLPYEASSLGLEATFEVTPRIGLPSGTQLILTLDPGAGASAGRGQFVVQATPIS